jgi:hypothetical protein
MPPLKSKRKPRPGPSSRLCEKRRVTSAVTATEPSGAKSPASANVRQLRQRTSVHVPSLSGPPCQSTRASPFGTVTGGVAVTHCTPVVACDWPSAR